MSVAKHNTLTSWLTLIAAIISLITATYSSITTGKELTRQNLVLIQQADSLQSMKQQILVLIKQQNQGSGLINSIATDEAQQAGRDINNTSYSK